MKIEWLIANVTAPGSLPEQKVFIKLCSIYLGQFRQLLAENDRFGQFWRFLANSGCLCCQRVTFGSLGF